MRWRRGSRPGRRCLSPACPKSCPPRRWSAAPPHRALAIRGEAPPPELRRLPVSCVCIQGTRDVLVPPSTVERLAASLPPGTPRHLLRGAGHVPYFTHPEACAGLLRPWLAALDAPAVPEMESSAA
ncbi:alpha/beta hydrolase [Myxococcus sp. MxC21-1]|uniref:alpha/beta fold hydrolase n=1 Tax=Myxococcus sp. MxC21-1 TaxID=3041439 RepID=UPI00292F6827|nr:alpha/beta hydrolase [Myxococcus sp. MxC21-1]WNZ60248.1 alpha/beta hydrolase [Myxococcus sp. MxC21-1]